jgi:hypothetical protein
MALLFMFGFREFCDAETKKELKRQYKIDVEFVPEVAPEKPEGHFILHEHTVEVMDLNGDNRMTLPRRGPGHPYIDFDEESKRVWPMGGSDAYWKWVFRVQHATDLGDVPRMGLQIKYTPQEQYYIDKIHEWIDESIKAWDLRQQQKQKGEK